MQRFNINWTAKALTNQMEKGKVNYDNAVQRNLMSAACISRSCPNGRRIGSETTTSPSIIMRILRTVKGRTHFISCAYYCCLAVENGVNQDEINRTLTEFFSGHPSKSPEYNHTVSAGSAKPASVQTRRDVIRSLLPVADEVKEPDPEKADPDDMDDTEQFKEENYAV